MAITALPTPPTRSDPTNFAVRADAFLTALPTFVTEANALQTDVNAKQSTASTAATTATTQSATATTQAGIATAQAVIATTQASTATTQATNANTSFLNIDKKFLGSKTANPTLDNQGAALVAGCFYWNSSTSELRFYDGAAWNTQNLIVANFVDLASAQTIGGNKTFSNTIVGSISGNAGTVTNGVYIVGTQTIGGAKTFSSSLSIINGTADVTLTMGSSGGYYYASPTAVGWFKTGAGTYSFTVATGDFVASGNVSGYSDARLKKDWENLPDTFVDSLSKVKSGTYERIDTGSRQVGVSAQSLQELLPEAVLENADGLLSVAYGNAALAACIELAKEVVYLRNEINKLKGA